jgi:hypothetical protein
MNTRISNVCCERGRFAYFPTHLLLHKIFTATKPAFAYKPSIRFCLMAVGGVIVSQAPLEALQSRDQTCKEGQQVQSDW